MPTQYKGEEKELILSPRVCVTVKELNADEAEFADALASVPDGSSTLFVFRAIAATRAFCAVTKVNGEDIPPVIDKATLKRVRGYFSAREGMELMDKYSELYVMTPEEQEKLKNSSEAP